ncbi:MAG: heavy-metal-associated domain-containing protein [Ginsengibacter sp.]|jgi:copper chaperone CopZ
MKKYQYKTNIMCGSCIAKVSPVLNEIAGENNWDVDLKDPKRILTVSSNSDNENKIVTALQKIGYKAEEIK